MVDVTPDIKHLFSKTPPTLRSLPVKWGAGKARMIDHSGSQGSSHQSCSFLCMFKIFQNKKVSKESTVEAQLIPSAKRTLSFHRGLPFLGDTVGSAEWWQWARAWEPTPWPALQAEAPHLRPDPLGSWHQSAAISPPAPPYGCARKSHRHKEPICMVA